MICWRRYSEEEEVTSFMVFYWIKQAFDTPVCEEDIFPNDDIESFIKVCQGRNRTGGIFGVVFSICSNSLIFRLQVLIFNCDWSWKIAENWCTFYLDYQNQLNFKFLLWSFLVFVDKPILWLHLPAKCNSSPHGIYKSWSDVSDWTAWSLWKCHAGSRDQAHFDLLWFRGLPHWPVLCNQTGLS